MTNTLRVLPAMHANQAWPDFHKLAIKARTSEQVATAGGRAVRYTEIARTDERSVYFGAQYGHVEQRINLSCRSEVSFWLTGVRRLLTAFSAASSLTSTNNYRIVEFEIVSI